MSNGEGDKQRIIMIIVWLICVSMQSVMGDISQSLIEDEQILYVAGLIPFTKVRDEEDFGDAILPAIQLALTDVNQDKHVLPYSKLELYANDTGCDMAVGTKLFFDMMHDPPQKVMLFGDACFQVTAPIARSSIWWNIWQLSYADTNPILSNREKYQNFFRTVPSDSDYNPARIAFMRVHNWTRVGTLFQDASRGSTRYAYAHNELTVLLDEAEFEQITESFSSDPKPALAHLKEKDVRIIIGNFDEEMARLVFCAALEQQMFGEKYVWITLGDYPDDWWKVNDTKATCTSKQLQRVLEGYIGMDVLPLSTSGELTVANITAENYNQRYNKIRGSAYSKFHGYAYDGIWVIAKAMNAVIAQNNGVINMEDFRSEKIKAALNDTDLIGVTGRVSFHDGDRIGSILIEQYQRGKMVKVGEYNAYSNQIELLTDGGLQWHGDAPPRDRTLREEQLNRVNITVFAIMCILAGFGILLALAFLAMNIKFRKHKYIKMSSPNLNNLIICGCLLAYTSVFLLGTDGGLISPSSFPFVCSIRSWVLCVAFTLSFGAMFSKTWRVHAIFTNIKLNRKVIHDYKLVLMVAVLLSIDFIILATWQSIDPFRRQTKNLPAEIDPGGDDREIIPVIELCISDKMTIWLAVIYVYKGLLLVFGCFLAWETRQVSVPALNDSKYIGMSVYNIVIMCVAGVPISFLIKDRPNAAYLIIALFIIFCTTITICLVFVPKLIELKRDPIGDDKRLRATLRKSAVRDKPSSDIHVKIRLLTEENHQQRQILEGKKCEIRDLLLQLGEETAMLDGISRSPAHKAVLALKSDSTHVTTRSDGTLSSDDEMSLLSSSSANYWTIEGPSRHGPSRQVSIETENIELTDVGKDPLAGKVSPCGGMIITEEEASVSEQPVMLSHAGNLATQPPPSYNDVIKDKLNKPFTSSSRTPSYQGLKYLTLSDIYTLKETAILSSSESEDEEDNMGVSRDIAEIQEQDDELVDATTSLLS